MVYIPLLETNGVRGNINSRVTSHYASASVEDKREGGTDEEWGGG